MPEEIEIAIHPDFVQDIKDDEEKYLDLIACAGSFEYFLRFWKFQDPDTGEVNSLGDRLWKGQRKFIQLFNEHDMIFALKARKLGFTTLECAFDAWCLRFRDPNGRVHMFSRRQDAANDLMNRCKFGLKRLPEWMQLPFMTDSTSVIKLYAGPNDERVAQAYPADEDTAVEQSCTHAHVDEWWRMRNPRAVWGSIGPTVTRSAHIITNGKGNVGFPADVWKDALAGKNQWKTFFVGALERDDRDVEWLEKIKGDYTKLEFRHQYPLTWQDALAGSSELMFDGALLERANMGAWGKREPKLEHTYVKSWDIGRDVDAAVGIVLDVTERPFQVVHYVRLVRSSYPMIQAEITRTHLHYHGGKTYIEDNNAGKAVRENLDFDEDEVEGWWTSQKTKATMLADLVVSLQNEDLKYDHESFEQLHNEMSTYTKEDQKLTQDSVMALAIGNHMAKTAGRDRPRKAKIKRLIEL